MWPPRPGPDSDLDQHYCFGCGRHNPIGLHLHFEAEGDAVVAHYAPRAEDQGFPGIVHGGLLALMLDEAMAWSLYGERIFAVTATMEMRYRRAVAVASPLVVRGRVTRRAGRRFETEGTISDEAGEPLVTASALLVRMSREQEASMLALMERERARRAPGEPR